MNFPISRRFPELLTFPPRECTVFFEEFPSQKHCNCNYTQSSGGSDPVTKFYLFLLLAQALCRHHCSLSLCECNCLDRQLQQACVPTVPQLRQRVAHGHDSTVGQPQCAGCAAAMLGSCSREGLSSVLANTLAAISVAHRTLFHLAPRCLHKKR